MPTLLEGHTDVKKDGKGIVRARMWFFVSLSSLGHWAYQSWLSSPSKNPTGIRFWILGAWATDLRKAEEAPRVSAEEVYQCRLYLSM